VDSRRARCACHRGSRRSRAAGCCRPRLAQCRERQLTVARQARLIARSARTQAAVRRG
jgi:hypothetical protein